MLGRAKASGFSALVVTVDAMLLGWRPHDLEKAYPPFAHGVGVQMGTCDPVFMASFGRESMKSHPKFPYDAAEMERLFVAGDKDVRDSVFLARGWMKELNQGLFCFWKELRFIQDHWDGPLVIKGIQSVQDAEKCLEYDIDGIVVSNHGMGHVPLGFRHDTN
jgi:isopentenyl diphosphate isomerase/L-lactate dehydrogenase-like FMN-dependent dehydrogenase